MTRDTQREARRGKSAEGSPQREAQGTQCRAGSAQDLQQLARLQIRRHAERLGHRLKLAA